MDSTTQSRRPRFPGARLGCCLRHARTKLPKTLAAIASPVRQPLRVQFPPRLSRARQRKSLRVFARGQQLRHGAAHVAQKAGVTKRPWARHWCQAQKAGWSAVLEDPQRLAMSTLLDQAPPALDQQLFLMPACHHPHGSQQAFLAGWAHLYTLLPDPCCAKPAGRCGVAVDGGKVPTRD
jgi:hypothetical protein